MRHGLFALHSLRSVEATDFLHEPLQLLVVYVPLHNPAALQEQCHHYQPHATQVISPLRDASSIKTFVWTSDACNCVSTNQQNSTCMQCTTTSCSTRSLIVCQNQYDDSLVGKARMVCKMADVRFLTCMSHSAWRPKMKFTRKGAPKLPSSMS